MGQQLRHQGAGAGNGDAAHARHPVSDGLHLPQLEQRALAPSVVPGLHGLKVTGHVQLADHLALLLPAPASADEDHAQGLQEDGQLSGCHVCIDVERAILAWRQGRAAQPQAGEHWDAPSCNGSIHALAIHAGDAAHQAQGRVCHLCPEHAAREGLRWQARRQQGAGELSIGCLEHALGHCHGGGVRDAVPANVAGGHASLGQLVIELRPPPVHHHWQQAKGAQEGEAGNQVGQVLGDHLAAHLDHAQGAGGARGGQGGIQGHAIGHSQVLQVSSATQVGGQATHQGLRGSRHCGHGAGQGRRTGGQPSSQGSMA